jgi:membrane-associated phospholipid phosphatase
MTHRLLFTLGIILLYGAQARAQSVPRMLADDITWAAKDFAAIWMSPIHGSARDYLITAGVLGGSAALSPFDDNVDRWALANRDRGLLDALGPVRKGGDLYSLNKAVPYVGGAYILALATKNRGLRDGIMGCASAYTAGTTIRHQVIYRLVGRDRPDTLRSRPAGTAEPPAQQGDQYHFSTPADGWKANSFPGGHVATVATCASFFAHRYEAKWVEPVVYTLVGAMGIGRIADRGHWLSDQVVGIAMGYAIGKEVARRQLRRLDDERGKTPTAPSRGSAFAGPSANGMMFGWQVTF